MAPLLRPAALALLLSAALGLLGTQSVAFTDYAFEAEPAAVALAAGHLGRFAELAPAYGGSLVLRAPLALAAGALGLGDDLALFRILALPALLLTGALGVALWRHARRAGASGAWLALVLAAANPLTLSALEYGHPEEAVGAVLCVGAMVLAVRDRATAAGVLLGLAMANKPWAVLAAVPVLLALQTRRGRCGLVAAGLAGAVMAPLLVAGTAAHALGAAATERTAIFTPWQLFWFLGKHAGPVYSFTGERPGYRTAVAWVEPITHGLVLVGGVALACAWAPRRRADTALALLALVLLTRCLLDTWTTSYYALPFVLALLTHEVHARRRAPWATLGVVLGLWTSFDLMPTPDARAAAFLLVACPAWAALALAAFAPARAAWASARLHRVAGALLPTLVGQPVSSRTALSTSPAAAGHP